MNKPVHCSLCHNSLNLNEGFTGLSLCNPSWRRRLHYWWFWAISAIGLLFKAIFNKKNMGKCYEQLGSNEDHVIEADDKRYWRPLHYIESGYLSSRLLHFSEVGFILCTNSVNNSREGINSTFVIGGVPITGVNRHITKKNIEWRGIKRRDTVRFTEKIRSPRNVRGESIPFPPQWKVSPFLNRWDNTHKCHFSVILMSSITEVSLRIIPCIGLPVKRLFKCKAHLH